ncbi:MAG: lipoyl synthase [Candidatus Thermochlorobacter aerophilum]|jgi:lipoic acid synthetase|uniref:Lipoyl synthase n=1 Tax=Candidatus Thermochlorobacter aerophilus TaxID=1868324 RepID=A0A395M0W5_9BACT|nr:MAG: lipoyl synthase [Candidatus Thermochlorobacter aerophilum]
MITVPELKVLESPAAPKPSPRPDWLRVKVPSGEGYARLKALIDQHRLHTVCEEARCPNIAECWASGTATIMILGDTCTRSCGFCAVKTGRPNELDLAEPKRVAAAVKLMNLRHTVITSVNRDELDDGGASIWAETIREIRKAHPTTRIEVLIPDFQGNVHAWDTVMQERPEILNHNTETVPRLYRLVRPQAKYQRTLELLKYAKEKYGLVTKSGLMVGLGETPDEVIAVMHDLRKVGCDILSIGQYLQPTKAHLPVARFVHPEEFEHYKRIGLEIGFHHVESGPLVRSSYHAAEQASSMTEQG